MLLIFLDSEMSGLDPSKHRLLEIAFVVVDSITGRRVTGYESIVSQSSDVWAASDPISLKVNGFTWEKTLLGKSEKTIQAEIIHDLNHAGVQEKSGVFICQNPSLDRAFFTQLISVKLQEELKWPYHWLDLASMSWALRQREDKFHATQLCEKDLSKNRIAEYYGIAPEERPHRAMGGVEHLMACYEAMFGKIGCHV